MFDIKKVNSQLSEFEFEKIVEDVNNKSKEIPFGNSAFQNIINIPNRTITKGRILRECLLKSNSIIQSIRDNYYKIKENELNNKIKEIELMEMKENLEIEKNNYSKEKNNRNRTERNGNRKK